jgi:hypothetical protein
MLLLIGLKETNFKLDCWTMSYMVPCSGQTSLQQVCIAWVHPRSFFKKRDKKNSKKRSWLGKIRKMGTSCPLIGPEAWGRGPPAQPAGGRFQKYFEAPLESLFANKKSYLLFLIREEVPEAGVPPGQWVKRYRFAT